MQGKQWLAEAIGASYELLVPLDALTGNRYAPLGALTNRKCVVLTTSLIFNQISGRPGYSCATRNSGRQTMRRVSFLLARAFSALPASSYPCNRRYVGRSGGEATSTLTWPRRARWAWKELSINKPEMRNTLHNVRKLIPRRGIEYHGGSARYGYRSGIFNGLNIFHF